MIRDNITAVQQAIAVCLEKNARTKKSLTLLAVSKKFPAETIRQAYEAGLRHFGENYLQEAIDKIKKLADLKIEWHYIGAIQSNKVKQIAEYFDWVQTVDRLKVARLLDDERTNHPLNVCIQVNIDNEPTKAGVKAEEVGVLAEQIRQLSNLRLRGLMAIPRASDDVEIQQQSFAKMHALFNELNRKGFELDTLSMGMSRDYALAIKYGATIIRIGTAIFGRRE